MNRDQSKYHGYGKDADWNLPTNLDGRCTWQGVEIAILMDIRSELRRIRNVFECRNALDIPFKLDRIERLLKRKRKAKKSKR